MLHRFPIEKRYIGNEYQKEPRERIRVLMKALTIMTMYPNHGH